MLGKPDPEVWVQVARRLRVPVARCVVFEDAPVGIQAARAAGMRFVAAGWGYHGEGGDPNAWDADAVIARPGEFLDLLS
jgi:phosphoglycolate phosphatase